MTDKPLSQYEQDLRIDPNALDIEFLEQPMKFFKYAELLARANREFDRLEQRLEVVIARTDSIIRLKYIEKKPPESAIANEVILNKDVIQAKEDLANQKEEVSLLSAAVRAFDQRKGSIEGETKLLSLSYFAAPKEPRNIGNEYEKRNQQTKETARERIAESVSRRVK